MYYANKLNLAFSNIKKTRDILKNIATGYDHINSQPIPELKLLIICLLIVISQQINVILSSQTLAQFSQIKFRKDMVIS